MKVGFEMAYDVTKALAAMKQSEAGFAAIEKGAKAAGIAVDQEAMKFAKGMALHQAATKGAAPAAKGTSGGASPAKAAESGGIGAMAVAKGMMLAQVAMGAISKGWGALMEQMPFLSQAFDMAGKVLMANLVYPLAQELMPLVIQLFQWVQEHRVDFVQLGTVLVSIFRLAKFAITETIGMLTTFWDTFTASIGAGKLTLMDFIDFMNFIVLKVALVFTIIKILLKPLMGAIGEIFGFVWKKAIKPFIDGFTEGLGKSFPALIRQFKGLMASLEPAILMVKDAWKAMELPVTSIASKFGVFFASNNPIMLWLKALVWALTTAVKLWVEMIKGIDGAIDSFKRFFGLTGKFEATQATKDELAKVMEARRAAIDSGMPPEEAKKKFPLPRAAGGPVSAGQSYIVGEHRPELFMPNVNGRILPYVPGGGGGQYADNRTMTFNISNPNPGLAAAEVEAILKRQAKPDFRSMFNQSSFRYS